jgi:hypothetical protein
MPSGFAFDYPPQAVHSDTEKVGILHLSAVFGGEIGRQWLA